jgi:hypothetical protein
MKQYQNHALQKHNNKMFIFVKKLQHRGPYTSKSNTEI